MNEFWFLWSQKYKGRVWRGRKATDLQEVHGLGCIHMQTYEVFSLHDAQGHHSRYEHHDRVH